MDYGLRRAAQGSCMPGTSLCSCRRLILKRMSTPSGSLVANIAAESTESYCIVAAVESHQYQSKCGSLASGFVV